METYQVSEMFSATTVQTYEVRTGRLISDVHSIRTLIRVVQPTSTKTYSFVSPVAYRETVYK